MHIWLGTFLQSIRTVMGFSVLTLLTHNQKWDFGLKLGRKYRWSVQMHYAEEREWDFPLVVESAFPTHSHRHKA